MTAGAEVVCSEVACKVEIEKCVSGLNSSGLNGVGAVATVDCNVGGNANANGKVGNGDCTFVFLNGGIEVSSGDSGDTGGFNVDDFVPISDLTDEVDQFKKEELGVENGGIHVDPLASKINGIVHEFATVSIAQVKTVEDDMNFENGSTVDLSVVLVTDGFAQDANGHLDKVSDLADKVDQFEKEEIGVEKEGIPVDPLVSKTNGIVQESATVCVSEVKTVKDDVNFEIGSNVDPRVVLVIDGIAQDENGHLEKVSRGQEAEVQHTEKVVDTKALQYVEAKTDNIGSGLTFGVESTLNIIESSQVMVSESESVIKPPDVIITQSLSTPDVINRTDESLTINNTNYKVMVNDGSESISNLIDKAECQVVDESGNTSDGLQCQVIADGSESFGGSPIEEWEGQATIDGSGKPSEDSGSQVRADDPEFCGSPIKERESKVSVAIDEPEPSANHIEKGGFNTIGMELDGKSEEHEELLVITAEVNVEVEPNHSCSVIEAVKKKAEATDIHSGTGSEENPDSGHLLSEKVDALANGQVEKLEMGDTQIFGTEANGSSAKLLKVTESVEMELSTEERKGKVKVEDGILESQRVVIDNVQDDLNLDDNVAESFNEAEVSLEAETDIVTVIHENMSSQDGVSDWIDKPQEGLQQEAISENLETTNTLESECDSCELLVEKDNGSLSNPDDLTVVEQKVEIESHLGTENKSADGMYCGTGIENVDDSNDNEKETEVKDADDLAVGEQKFEIESHLGTKNISAEGMDCGTGIANFDVSDDGENETKAEDVPHPVSEIMSPEGMNCGTLVESVVAGDEEKEAGVKDAHVEFVHHFIPENRSSEDRDCGTGIKNVNFPDAPVIDRSTLSFSDTIVNNGAVIEFGSIRCLETTLSIQNEEVEGMNGIKSDVPNSSIEGEVNDSIDVQNEEVEVLEYNFLVKIPQFEDENFRDQIRSAQELVEEKTRLRDSIRAKVLEKREILRSYNKEYDAAKQEEIAARRAVKAKRENIEAVQAVINRWKNAMSVEDIDKRILHVEHMIQHETIRLIDEKEFIREIKQLKGLRDQLASNMGTPEEIRHAIDMKDHNVERMTTLRKELDSLKAEVAKVLVVVEKIVAKYEKTSSEERELQLQFRDADDVRQRAYGHLNNLKKLSYDKNQNFRQFKEDVSTAKTFLSQGDKDALHHICANQVETFMEQWNNDDEFRKEYVSRCNMIAIRRHKALGRAPLVSDDVAPVLGNVNKKVDRSLVSIPDEVKHMSVVLPAEQGKDASSTENKEAGKSTENVSDQKNQELKSEAVAKSTNLGSGNVTKEEAEMAVVTELAENILTKEEIELARKAEELRKEEIAAKLKEQRRLEEKAKAIEALERKKRNAEKAQLRAELWARKEVELKEKEREKRLRKKEKKTGGGDGSINGDEAAGSEGSNEAASKEIETVANKKKTQKPPAHFFSKQLKPKPVPPPLLNKNKKRWQQWGQPALAVLALLAVFLLANFGLFFDFKSSKVSTPF